MFFCFVPILFDDGIAFCMVRIHSCNVPFIFDGVFPWYFLVTLLKCADLL